MIPEAAVEAAAIRLWGKHRKDDKALRRLTLVALEAAAPHIGAWAHEVPIDLTRATVAMASVDDGSADWTTPGRGPVESNAFIQRMLEKAWDEGAAAGALNQVAEDRCEDPHATNPYRPTP